MALINDSHLILNLDNWDHQIINFWKYELNESL
jgi:hypothetical protein